jgi:hypothetical protein
MCHKHTAIIPDYTAYPCEVSYDALIQIRIMEPIIVSVNPYIPCHRGLTTFMW